MRWPQPEPEFGRSLGSRRDEESSLWNGAEKSGPDGVDLALKVKILESDKAALELRDCESKRRE